MICYDIMINDGNVFFSLMKECFYADSFFIRQNINSTWKAVEMNTNFPVWQEAE